MLDHQKLILGGMGLALVSALAMLVAGVTLHEGRATLVDAHTGAVNGARYSAENILIHEFAHAIHEMGLVHVDPTFDRRLRERLHPDEPLS